MQDVRAPFVLENLECSGTEERLLDCPGPTLDDAPYPAQDYTYYDTEYDDRLCSAGGSNYAFVACGMLSDASTQHRNPLLRGLTVSLSHYRCTRTS